MSEHDETPEPHATPEGEARRIATAQEWPRRIGLWETAGNSKSPYGTARVCRAQPTQVLLVIGESEMAQRLREIYAAGEVVGWSLQPMPESRTPLHQVRGPIADAVGGSSRGYNQLNRHGFVYAEEVQACPDEALLDIRNLGTSVLARIRTVLPYTGAEPPPARPATPLTSPPRQRDRELVNGLATSAMPAGALKTIVAALNAEPVPPADDLVELLLDTAGLIDILALYRATHQRREHDTPVDRKPGR